jgi:glycerol kinase
MVGTVDSWLIYKLTGGVSGGVHVTDITNASRTMLMDINTCTWSDSLCKAFGFSSSILPAIKSSAELMGNIKSVPELLGCGITAAVGDQQAAMLGQLCLRIGDTKNTFGTGSFMLRNTGNKPVQSTHGLLTTPCYQLGPHQPVTYALEGSVATAGAAIDWAKVYFLLAPI